MKKRLVFCMILTVLTVAPAAIVHAGQWINVDGSYWYQNDDGSAYTGWLKSGEKWYFLDRETCYMRTGWVSDGGKWYYCYDDGSMHPGGWLELGRKKYFMYEDGSMASGIFQLGYYRYQTKEDGSIIHDTTKNGIKYDEQGCMMVKDDDGKWAYLPPTDDIEFQAEAKLKDRYLNHEYANQHAFESAVKKSFGGLWSEDEIADFIREMEEEFFEMHNCMYNYYTN